MHARTCPIRAVAEAPCGSGDAHVQSTATRLPRPQAVRARGASLLPFRLPARPSPDAPWEWGLMSVFWERGSPDLPACGLRRGSKGGPARPIFSNTNPRTSRGAKPHEADDAKLPQARVPARAASSFPLWCKGASAAAEYRGIRKRLPFRCNETVTREQ